MAWKIPSNPDHGSLLSHPFSAVFRSALPYPSTLARTEQTLTPLPLQVSQPSFCFSSSSSDHNQTHAECQSVFLFPRISLVILVQILFWNLLALSPPAKAGGSGINHGIYRAIHRKTHSKNKLHNPLKNHLPPPSENPFENQPEELQSSKLHSALWYFASL